MAVAAGAAVLVAIVTGSALALWQAKAAVVEERHAREVKEFLASMFRDADPYQGSGKSLAVTDLLRQARARVDTLKARPELRVELLTLIGTSLLNLEDLDAAEQAAQQALEEALATLGPDHEQTLHARVLMLGVIGFAGALRRCVASSRPWSVRSPTGRSECRGEGRAPGESRPSVDRRWRREGGCIRRTASLRSRPGSFGERDARTVSAATLLAEAQNTPTCRPRRARAAERAFGFATALYGEESQHPRMINVRDVYGRALAAPDACPRAYSSYSAQWPMR